MGGEAEGWHYKRCSVCFNSCGREQGTRNQGFSGAPRTGQEAMSVEIQGVLFQHRKDFAERMVSHRISLPRGAVEPPSVEAL